MKSKKLSQIGEKQIINHIIEKFGNQYIGDDAAILENNTNNLVLTSDMLIETHHLPEEMNYEDMGFKIVTVNVSDIAAMGAKPIGFLLNIATPKNLKLKNFDEILEGVKKACNEYNTVLLGGDTNESEEIILSGMAIGKIEKNKEKYKNTAETGDLIGITGKIGQAALGFKLLETNINTEYSKKLKEKILKPKAKYKEGEILKNHVTSITDITDGLAEELYEMKENKNIGFKLYEEKIPIDKEYKELTKELEENLEELLFNFGEDFELLFTINKKEIHKLKEQMNFYIIGEVTDTNKVEIVDLNNNIKKLERKGYEHMK